MSTFLLSLCLYRLESYMGKVIIKHNDKFDGSTITPQFKADWLRDTGWTEEQVKHYDNADGKLSTLDVIMMQKWLLNIPNAKLTDWKAGDLHENGKINVFDLGLLRHLLLNQK